MVAVMAAVMAASCEQLIAKVIDIITHRAFWE
jgi:hypothetical protein